MASSAVIQYLRLDENYDLVFDNAAALTDAQAVAQAIGTRLRLFLGEWWENLSLGLPVFQTMLGHLASQQGQAAMALAVQQNVAGAPYVTAVNDVSVNFANGALSIQVKAQTRFGTVTVNAAPPSDATIQ